MGLKRRCADRKGIERIGDNRSQWPLNRLDLRRPPGGICQREGHQPQIHGESVEVLRSGSRLRKPRLAPSSSRNTAVEQRMHHLKLMAAGLMRRAVQNLPGWPDTKKPRPKPGLLLLVAQPGNQNSPRVRDLSIGSAAPMPR